MAWDTTFDELLEHRAPELRVEHDAPMANYTSFRIGGPARRMAFPENEAEIRSLVKICRELDVRYFVIGRGTNLLAADAGLDCVVVNMTGMHEIRTEPDGAVYAQAGALLSQIAVRAQQAGYAGFAFAHGIPGSLGGAVAMNAGAYGGEMKQVVRSVTALFEDGVRTLAGDALHFDYRHSVFTETPGIILSAVLQLTPDGDRAAIRAEMDELMRRRKASQPLEYPSAGSTFKRPKGFYAGTMIDECGLKGAAVGGAEVSEKHAGFIINKDHATFRDVVELIGVVQDTVFREYGVELEPEVKILE